MVVGCCCQSQSFNCDGTVGEDVGVGKVDQRMANYGVSVDMSDDLRIVVWIVTDGQQGSR